jgi:hypothetical protein
MNAAAIDPTETTEPAPRSARPGMHKRGREMSDPKMREDFEAWACSHEVYEDDGERLPMTRLSGCYYEHVQTQAAWEAWQASRDALAAQRDEGLAREAALREQVRKLDLQVSEYDYTCDAVYRERDTLKQRLAEAVERVQESQAELLAMKAEVGFRGFTLGVIGRNDHFLGQVNEASPGCADGEKAK